MHFAWRTNRRAGATQDDTGCGVPPLQHVLDPGENGTGTIKRCPGRSSPALPDLGHNVEHAAVQLAVAGPVQHRRLHRPAGAVGALDRLPRSQTETKRFKPIGAYVLLLVCPALNANADFDSGFVCMIHGIWQSMASGVWQSSRCDCERTMQLGGHGGTLHEACKSKSRNKASTAMRIPQTAANNLRACSWSQSCHAAQWTGSQVNTSPLASHLGPCAWCGLSRCTAGTTHLAARTWSCDGLRRSSR